MDTSISKKDCAFNLRFLLYSLTNPVILCKVLNSCTISFLSQSTFFRLGEQCVLCTITTRRHVHTMRSKVFKLGLGKSFEATLRAMTDNSHPPYVDLDRILTRLPSNKTWQLFEPSSSVINNTFNDSTRAHALLTHLFNMQARDPRQFIPFNVIVKVADQLGVFFEHVWVLMLILHQVLTSLI